MTLHDFIMRKQTSETEATDNHINRSGLPSISMPESTFSLLSESSSLDEIIMNNKDPLLFANVLKKRRLKMKRHKLQKRRKELRNRKEKE
jgi:Mitochondrial domain of unknown function (DUF1713)